MDRELTPQEAALFDLLTELVSLSGDTENAGRIMVLSADGRFIGDATLSARDIDIATKALTAARAFTEATKDIPVPAEAVLDPVVEQDFEEYCIGLDPDFLMDLAAQDPNSAVAAFDELTSDCDGEL